MDTRGIVGRSLVDEEKTYKQILSSAPPYNNGEYMTWILMFINITVSPIQKEVIGYYPDLKSCQTEREELYWITPMSAKAICVENKEQIKQG